MESGHSLPTPLQLFQADLQARRTLPSCVTPGAPRFAAAVSTFGLVRTLVFRRRPCQVVELLLTLMATESLCVKCSDLLSLCPILLTSVRLHHHRCACDVPIFGSLGLLPILLMPVGWKHNRILAPLPYFHGHVRLERICSV